MGADTPVALEIAGAHFSGILNAKQMDRSNPALKWKVVPEKRKPPGTVTLNASKVNLANAFAKAGAVAPSAPNVTVTIDVPVHIDIGDRAFDVTLKSDFNFDVTNRKQIRRMTLLNCKENSAVFALHLYSYTFRERFSRFEFTNCPVNRTLRHQKERRHVRTQPWAAESI